MLNPTAPQKNNSEPKKLQVWSLWCMPVSAFSFGEYSLSLFRLRFRRFAPHPRTFKRITLPRSSSWTVEDWCNFFDKHVPPKVFQLPIPPDTWLACAAVAKAVSNTCLDCMYITVHPLAGNVPKTASVCSCVDHHGKSNQA